MCGKQSPAAPAPKGQLTISLVNPLDWTHGSLVRLRDAKLPAGEFELIDPITQAVIIYHLDADGAIEFLAPPVPAHGKLVLEVRRTRQRTISGTPGEWDGRMLALHTADHTLQFHTAGGLARWHDRARSTQWCSDKSEFPMGTFLGEKADGVGGGGPATVTCEINAVYARVHVTAAWPGRPAGSLRYLTTFTAYQGRPEIHVRLQIHGALRRSTAAGYAFFPLSGEKPRVILLQSPEGAAAYGVRIQQQHTGMNLFLPPTVNISFGRPNNHRISKRGICPDGILYAGLFGVNEGNPAPAGDLVSYEFLLQPTGNDKGDGGLARGAAEVSQPLLARVVRASVSTGRLSGRAVSRALSEAR